jgi:hemoglobin
MQKRILVAILVICALFGTYQASYAKDKSLFERLGGKEAIKLVVDKFVSNVLADASIQPFFAITANEPGRADKLKVHLVEQICQVTGGPCAYKGRDMKTAHTGMGITNPQFDSLVSALVGALEHYKVAKKEQDELLGILGPLREVIVEKK